MHQPAQQRVLLEHLSYTVGPFQCSYFHGAQVHVLIGHIASAICRARCYTYCIRNGLVPADIVAFCGMVTPSSGHVKRICRIMKSEIWRQVRLLYDWIRVLCCARDPDWIAEEKMKIFRWVAMQKTEFLWQRVLHFMPRKVGKAPVKPCSLVLLGDASVPEGVAALLEKGPKYSVPPRIPTHELLALNRKLAYKAGEDGERCLLDGVDSIVRTARKRDLLPKDSTQQVVSFFERNDLRLLQADKGGFVVMSMSSYKEKAAQALSKNFVQVSRKACRVKTKAIAMCNEMELSKLANAISKCKKGTLDVFFAVKTHKLDMPFRCIVSERGTWLQQVSSFLLDHLKTLDLRDPFLTRNSTDVITFLKEQTEIGYLFLIDVEDLFYSVPHAELFMSVRECCHE